MVGYDKLDAARSAPKLRIYFRPECLTGCVRFSPWRPKTCLEEIHPTQPSPSPLGTSGFRNVLVGRGRPTLAQCRLAATRRELAESGPEALERLVARSGPPISF